MIQSLISSLRDGETLNVPYVDGQVLTEPLVIQGKSRVTINLPRNTLTYMGEGPMVVVDGGREVNISGLRGRPGVIGTQSSAISVNGSPRLKLTDCNFFDWELPSIFTASHWTSTEDCVFQCHPEAASLNSVEFGPTMHAMNHKSLRLRYRGALIQGKGLKLESLDVSNCTKGITIGNANSVTIDTLYGEDNDLTLEVGGDGMWPQGVKIVNPVIYCNTNPGDVVGVKINNGTGITFEEGKFKGNPAINSKTCFDIASRVNPNDVKIDNNYYSEGVSTRVIHRG